jgi:hypothetical protein
MKRILKPHDSRVSFKNRLYMAAFGFAMIAAGILQLRSGHPVGLHWTGQPLWWSGLVAVGIVSLIIAALPNPIIKRIAKK